MCYIHYFDYPDMKIYFCVNHLLYVPIPDTHPQFSLCVCTATAHTFMFANDTQ